MGKIVNSADFSHDVTFSSSAPCADNALTSFLHEGEEIVQEVLSLWVLIYLVKLQ
jgi:hypothetical protein